MRRTYRLRLATIARRGAGAGVIETASRCLSDSINVLIEFIRHTRTWRLKGVIFTDGYLRSVVCQFITCPHPPGCKRHSTSRSQNVCRANCMTGLLLRAGQSSDNGKPSKERIRHNSTTVLLDHIIVLKMAQLNGCSVKGAHGTSR